MVHFLSHIPHLWPPCPHVRRGPWLSCSAAFGRCVEPRLFFTSAPEQESRPDYCTYLDWCPDFRRGIAAVYSAYAFAQFCGHSHGTRLDPSYSQLFWTRLLPRQAKSSARPSQVRRNPPGIGTRGEPVREVELIFATSCQAWRNPLGGRPQRCRGWRATILRRPCPEQCDKG